MGEQEHTAMVTKKMEDEIEQIEDENEHDSVNKRDEALQYLFTGFFRQNGLDSPALVNALSRLIFVPSYDDFSNLLNALIADQRCFEKFNLFVRNEAGDDIQVRLVLIDQFGFEYDCDTTNAITLKEIKNEEQFEQNMARDGFVKIEAEAMGIGEFWMTPARFLAFIREKNRNFSIDFIYDFISAVSTNTRWESSEGLIWFLKFEAQNPLCFYDFFALFFSPFCV